MNDRAHIRLCTPGDEFALSLLGQATFLESFAGMLDGADILAHCASKHSLAVYQRWLQSEDVSIWIAEIEPGNAPVGYLVLTPPDLPIADPRTDDREIKRIYLLHPFQGSGLGKRLMQEAFAHVRQQGCRRVLLGVFSRNTNAIAFYQRLGFVNVGDRIFKVGNTDCSDIVLALTL